LLLIKHICDGSSGGSGSSSSGSSIKDISVCVLIVHVIAIIVATTIVVVAIIIIIIFVLSIGSVVVIVVEIVVLLIIVAAAIIVVATVVVAEHVRSGGVGITIVAIVEFLLSLQSLDLDLHFLILLQHILKHVQNIGLNVSIRQHIGSSRVSQRISGEGLLNFLSQRKVKTSRDLITSSSSFSLIIT